MASEAGTMVSVDDEGVSDLSSTVSSTTSLRSSLLRYPIEHGRQYHAYKDGTYSRPNDEAELDRLDLMHAMLSIVYDGELHFAPIGPTPQRILDIGAGSGIWCIEMGERFPSAQVLGVDLSANMPTVVPPTVTFLVDDVEDQWTFSQPFDFIHSRYMAASIQDWPKLVGQCFQHTKPGGWVEFGDFDIDYYSLDGSLKPDSALRRWLETMNEAALIRGRTNTPGPNLEGWLRDAGFHKVQVVKQVLPIGTWPRDKKLKKIGAYNLAQLYEGLQAFSYRLLLNLLGWKLVEAELLLAEVRKDLLNPGIHAIFDFYAVWAQKPGNGQEIL